MGKTPNQQLDEVTVPTSNQVPLKPPLVEGMTSDDEDDDGMGSHLSDEKEEDEVTEKLRKKKYVLYYTFRSLVFESRKIFISPQK